MVFTSCDIYKPSSSSPAAPCPQELAPNFTFVYATRVECSRARKGTRPANTPAGGLDVPFECPHVPTSVRKSSQSVRKWRELKTILRRQLCSSEEVRRLPPCPSRREPKGTGTRTPLPTWSSHLRGVRELIVLELISRIRILNTFFLEVFFIRSALYSSPAKIEHSPTDFQSSKMYLKTQP